MTRSFDLPRVAAALAAHPREEDSAEPGWRAAVAAILRDVPGGEAELLFIVRAERAGDPWSGHIAFPGGRRDEADADLLKTALRETREELGLDLEVHGTLLARLPDLPAIARGRRVGIVIAPFVFALRGAPELAANHEVAEAFWTPLGPLARGEGASTFPYVFEGKDIELPCIWIGERKIWGLTYQMLQSLFGALRQKPV